jgi:Flp pilus assembly protein TadG
MALVLPILMLVLTGIFSFGIAMANYMQLTEAVSVGGRTLAVSRGQYLDPCAAAVSAIQSAAPSLTPSKLTFTFVLNGTTYSGTSCSSSDYNSGAAGAITTAGNAFPPGSAQVIVTYPCNLAVYGRNLVPSCNLTAQTTELVQ